MGVLQRFERRLEGLVEGAFARAFGGNVQPVEIAAALQREAADRKAIVGQGRVLVPNDYVVELGETDAGRLQEYDEPLRKELGDMVTEHAQEQGWSFVGPVQVRFETIEEIGTGVFRVRSAVVAGGPPAAAPSTEAVRTGMARLEIAEGPGVGAVVALAPPSLVVGRSADAGLRLTDAGVSRRHAEFEIAEDTVDVVDLQSTNGTTVNGRRIDRARLHDGDRIGVGGTVLLFRQGV